MQVYLSCHQSPKVANSKNNNSQSQSERGAHLFPKSCFSSSFLLLSEQTINKLNEIKSASFIVILFFYPTDVFVHSKDCGPSIQAEACSGKEPHLFPSFFLHSCCVYIYISSSIVTIPSELLPLYLVKEALCS